MKKSSFCFLAASGVLAVLVLYIALNCGAIWPWADAVNVPRHEQGSLVSYVSTIENSLVSSGYQAPNAGDVARIKLVTSELLRAIASGTMAEFRNASYHASDLQYEMVRYTDVDHGTTHYILRERQDGRRGYGIFIFNSVQRSRVIVEAPHPQTDLYTGSVSIRVYADSNARAFLMATARTDAGPNADVSHEPSTFFEAVHEALVSAESIVIQLHGFSLAGHPSYPDVVISSGTTAKTPQIQELGKAFTARGFSVGIFDGHQWSDLSGTQNVQGRQVSLVGGTFIHIELELVMRTKNGDLTANTISSFVAAQSP
mgnify:CR=1 FL=1